MDSPNEYRDRKPTNSDNKRELRTTVAFHTALSILFVALSQIATSGMEDTKVSYLIITIAPSLATLAAGILLWFIQRWMVGKIERDRIRFVQTEYKSIDIKYDKIEEEINKKILNFQTLIKNNPANAQFLSPLLEEYQKELHNCFKDKLEELKNINVLKLDNYLENLQKLKEESKFNG